MSQLQLKAPGNSWKQLLDALKISVETSTESTASSFLSCVYLHTNNDGSLILETESQASTTYMELTGKELDCILSGTGQALLPVNQLVSYVQSLPVDDTIVLDIDTNEGKYSVYTETQGDMVFGSSTVEISNEDSVPRAQKDFAHATRSIVVDSHKLTSVYRSGSAMVSANSTHDLVGQDPLAGATMTITPHGLQVFSFSLSGSEAYLEGEEKQPGISDTVSFLSDPLITSARFSILSEYFTIELGVGEDNQLHCDTGFMHMTLRALNIGERSNKLNVSQLKQISNPVHEARTLDLSLNAKDFSEALGRISLVRGDTVAMDVFDVDARLSACMESGPMNSSMSYSQSVTISTRWFTEEEHSKRFGIPLNSAKQLVSLNGRNNRLNAEVAFTDDGSPWAMIVHDGFYEPEDPHNFYVVPLVAVLV